MGEVSARASGGRAFLTARWRDLCILSYAVDDALLRDRLAPGLELDRLRGRAFVSLVAFDFVETRVLGVAWPGLRSFPEINLRFYVRRGDRRGVMFVREYVPSRLVSAVARLRYNEPYRAAHMRSGVSTAGDAVRAEHSITVGGRAHTIRVEADAATRTPREDSDEHWFKEHRWGYGVSRRGRLLEYEVIHPVWEVRDVRRVELDVDWAALYGPEWGVLRGREPDSAVMAVGSGVEVHPIRRRARG